MVLKMIEFFRILARVCIAVYMVLSLFVIGSLVTGKQTFFATAITKKSLRAVDATNEETSTKKQENLGNSTIEIPAPTNDRYYGRLVHQGSLRSANHQRKFLARKARVASHFEARLRFQSQPGEYAAVILSDKYAFLHVWKCGGTTVVSFLGGQQLSLSEPAVQKREWVAFVRDPIDRFLSAWAECGFRQYEGSLSFGGFEAHSTLNWLDDHYDFRVRAFLHEVKDFTFPEVWGSCHTHAHPQANFMMNENGQIDHHVTLVGDLSEMQAVLRLADFNYTDLRKGRDAATNAVKAAYFPPRRDLLQDQTILELCQFLAIDYFLFDFQAPELCTQTGGPLARFV